MRQSLIKTDKMTKGLIDYMNEIEMQEKTNYRTNSRQRDLTDFFPVDGYREAINRQNKERREKIESIYNNVFIPAVNNAGKGIYWTGYGLGKAVKGLSKGVWYTIKGAGKTAKKAAEMVVDAKLYEDLDKESVFTPTDSEGHIANLINRMKTIGANSKKYRTLAELAKEVSNQLGKPISVEEVYADMTPYLDQIRERNLQKSQSPLQDNNQPTNQESADYSAKEDSPNTSEEINLPTIEEYANYDTPEIIYIAPYPTIEEEQKGAVVDFPGYSLKSNIPEIEEYTSQNKSVHPPQSPNNYKDTSEDWNKIRKKHLKKKT